MNRSQDRRAGAGEPCPSPSSEIRKRATAVYRERTGVAGKFRWANCHIQETCYNRVAFLLRSFTSTRPKGVTHAVRD